MVTKELHDFIETSLKQGLDLSKIKEELLKVGWGEKDVSEGLGEEGKVKIFKAEAENSSPPAPTDNSSPGFLVNFLIESLKEIRLNKPALLALILSVFLIIKPVYLYFSNWHQIIKNLPVKIEEFLENTIPEELIISIENGIASTNVTEPYFITLPKETLENFIPVNQGKRITRSNLRLLTINTKAKIEDYGKYQSVFLMTQKELVYYDGEYKNISFDKIKNVKISKEMLLEKYNGLNLNSRFGPIANTFSWLIPLFLFLLFYFSTLMSFLFFTFPIHIMTKIHRLSFEFGALYRYAAVNLTISSLLVGIFGLLPFMSNLLASLTSIGQVFALSLAYLGIHYYKKERDEIPA